MPINKLEQLRKYIFGIEIERIKFEQVKKKVKWICRNSFTNSDQKCITGESIVSIERNNKRYVATLLKQLRITEVMSKPKDSKQR